MSVSRKSITGIVLIVLMIISACSLFETRDLDQDQNIEESTNTSISPQETLTLTPIPTLTETPTEVPISLAGSVYAWYEGEPIEYRYITLCKIVDPNEEIPSRCILMNSFTQTDAEGNFAFDYISPGQYLIFYDSGRVNFETKLSEWGGTEINWSDKTQLSQIFGMTAENEGWVFVLIPWGGYSYENSLGFEYFSDTLLFGDTPFIIAHDFDKVYYSEVLEYYIVDIQDGQEISIEFPVIQFREGAYSGMEFKFIE